MWQQQSIRLRPRSRGFQPSSGAVLVFLTEPAGCGARTLIATLHGDQS